MESYNPERFSTLVPHRYSGFLHRAGQLFTDADFGVKIQNLDSGEKTSSVPAPAPGTTYYLVIVLEERKHQTCGFLRLIIADNIDRF